jgi:hypothetical protein
VGGDFLRDPGSGIGQKEDVMFTPTSSFLHRSSSIAMLAAALAALAACSSSSGTGTGGSGGSSSSSSSSKSASSSATSGSGGSPMVCPGPGFSGTATPVPGGSVTATIVDEKGMPVAAGQPIYICGTDICSDPGKTDATGHVTISTSLMMKSPAFKFGDAVTYAEFAIPLTTSTITFPLVGTGKLPATGGVFKAGADAVSGGVTISVPTGGSVSVNELVYDTTAKQQLRAVLLPLTNEAPVLAPTALGFEVLYALGPAGTLFCPAARVSVPNTAQWAAGTAVEFWVMTIDVGQEYAPYAGWAKASDGVVSADGMTVATSDGAGFLYLDNFGIRKKP